MKTFIFKYENYLFSRGIGIFRVEKSIRLLRVCFEKINKNVSGLGCEDIEQFFAWVNRQDHSAWSKRDYHIILRRFLRWAGRKDLTIQIRPPKGKSRIPNLLSQTEIDHIIEKTPHMRDKAMIACWFDSGCRVGEIAGVMIGDFSFSEYIVEMPVQIKPNLYQVFPTKRKKCYMSVFGKTGARVVELDGCVYYLEDWIKQHPEKSDPKALLWVDMHGLPLFSTYEQFRTHLQKIIGSAGIVKKITGQSFRHGRMTELERSLAETYLKKRHGTSQLSTYIHPEKGRQILK